MSSKTSEEVGQPLEGTPYRPLRRLAEGGMGEIYEAVGSTAEVVVVKVLKTAAARQPDSADRMRVEGEALALLSHPNIVASRGHGTTADGRPWVAMERLEGSTLQSELKQRGVLPLAEAIHCTRRVLSALRAVHRAGIVHRDVKPDNIMVMKREGAPPEVKLLDFGVAKVTGEGPIAPIAFPTMEGLCVGTPRYVSPEQARGASVDERSDIYATGLLLYTLVTGRGPFDEFKGAGNVLLAHITEEPPPPSRFTRTPIPASLEALILRAIAKNPDQRFADAASFSRELLMTMAKLCLPFDFVAKPNDIALALTAREQEAATVADGAALRAKSASGSRRSPVATGRSQPPAVSDSRSASRSRRTAAARVPVSARDVLLSAAAFAAVACGVAMWFVR
jgi:serine/threonine-protein kinase